MKRYECVGNCKNKYTFGVFLKMVISFIFTKIFWKKARIIRYPVFIHGKKRITYGPLLSLGFYTKIDAVNSSKKTLFIGKNCDFGNFTHISATVSVSIGDNFLCGDGVYIGDSCHGLYDNSSLCSNPNVEPSKRPIFGSEIVIGKNVWIGEHTSVLPGASIGDGCVIGANSVVTSSIPSFTIAVGNPAKPIKRWNASAKIWEAFVKNE